MVVEQLDRDDTTLKAYIFRSAWPVNIGEIELNSDTADALEEFEVQWRYQHFEASGVTGSAGSLRSPNTASFSFNLSGGVSI